MKFLFQFILIALLCLLLQLFLPWWICVIVACLVVAMTGSTGWQAFFAGFLGVGLLWMGYALYRDYITDSVLTRRVAGLFFLTSPFLLILITGFVGGLMGGLGALTGNYFYQWRFKRKRYRR